MIDSIRIQDFKGHRDTALKLGRLTVLVGPNGSGKTSVLEALELQRKLATSTTHLVFRGNRVFDDIGRYGTDEIILSSEGRWDGNSFALRLAVKKSLEIHADCGKN
ncbi:MAG TPA: AAA family ATPase, partial [Polyangium sp.]|nr:AAA family ATPase [Polyangium sp.]